MPSILLKAFYVLYIFALRLHVKNKHTHTVVYFYIHINHVVACPEHVARSVMKNEIQNKRLHELTKKKVMERKQTQCLIITKNNLWCERST